MESHWNKQLRETASRLVDENDRDLDAAAKCLVGAACGNEELMATLLGFGAYHAVLAVTAHARRTSWRRAESVNANPDDTAGLRIVANQTLLDTYRLVGGKPIGDATKEEVVASAQHHETLSISNGRAAKFERLVAKAMGSAEHVRDAVTEDKLEELQQAADRAKPGGVRHVA